MLPKRLDPPRYRQHAHHAAPLPLFLCMITVVIVLTCCLLVHRLRDESSMVAKRDPALEKKMKAACNMAHRKGGRAFLWDAYEWFHLRSHGPPATQGQG